MKNPKVNEKLFALLNSYSTEELTEKLKVNRLLGASKVMALEILEKRKNPEAAIVVEEEPKQEEQQVEEAVEEVTNEVEEVNEELPIEEDIAYISDKSIIDEDDEREVADLSTFKKGDEVTFKAKGADLSGKVIKVYKDEKNGKVYHKISAQSKYYYKKELDLVIKS